MATSKESRHSINNQNIQVYARVRPLNSNEKFFLRSEDIVDIDSHEEISIRYTGNSELRTKFVFDRVFGLDSNQVDVYSAVVAPLIEDVMCGYICTVLADGQSGTGKTYTMMGISGDKLKTWEDESDIGIIPRALCHIFNELEMRSLEFSMRVSYLELYKDDLCDLLSSDQNMDLRICSDNTREGSVIIQGLEEIPVHSMDDVYKLLKRGRNRRKSAITLMNAQSSRSHTVFSIKIKLRDEELGEGIFKVGKLNLVDLAGSSNATNHCNKNDLNTSEMVYTNQSLWALRRVISALVEKAPNVPYRESSLTYVLQDSLGGHAKTSIIATISPGHTDIEESLSTLEYAHLAKYIQNKPEVNCKSEKELIINELMGDIGNVFNIVEEAYDEITTKISELSLNPKPLEENPPHELSFEMKNVVEASSMMATKERISKTKQELRHYFELLLEANELMRKAKAKKKTSIDVHAATKKKTKEQIDKFWTVIELISKNNNQLYNNLMRRQDIDDRIQKAGELFSKHMHSNFEMLKVNLKQLQDQQLSCSNEVAQELERINNIHSDILRHKEETIQEMHKLCDNFLAKSSLDGGIYLNSFKQLSEEHQSVLMKILQEINLKQQYFQQQIKENLESLEEYSARHRSLSDMMRRRIRENFDNDNNSLKNNASEMGANITKMKHKSLENLKELQQITSNLREERSLLEEERKLIDEFQENMMILHRKRANLTNNTTENVQHLDAAQQVILNTASDTLVLNTEYLNRQSVEFDKTISLVENVVSQLQVCTDQSDAKCSSIDTQLENMQRESLKKEQEIYLEETKYLQNLNDKTQPNECSAKHLRSDYCEKIKRNTTNLDLLLDDCRKGLKNHLRAVENTNSSLEKFFNHYYELFNENMTTCAQDVTTFQCKELETHAWTKMMPSSIFLQPDYLTVTSILSELLLERCHQDESSSTDTTMSINEATDNLEKEKNFDADA